MMKAMYDALVCDDVGIAHCRRPNTFQDPSTTEPGPPTRGMLSFQFPTRTSLFIRPELRCNVVLLCLLFQSAESGMSHRYAIPCNATATFDALSQFSVANTLGGVATPSGVAGILP